MITTVNLFRKGRIAEGKVASALRDKGYFTRRSAGSRGYADVYARKGDTKLYIQVKSGSASPSSSEIRGLRRLARERGGIAMVMHRDKGKTRSRFV